MAAIPLLLYGAGGRMGRAVRDAAASAPDIALTLCVAPGKETGACPPDCAWITPEELGGAAGLKRFPPGGVVLDVSLAEGTRRLVELLTREPRALVAATTGLDEATEAGVAALGTQAAVLRAPNLSLGNALMLWWLSTLPDAALGAYEADVIEHHHAGKRDAPSGTARQLAQMILARRMVAGGAVGRGGARKRDEVRIHSIRSGTVSGTHRLILAGEGETVEIVHTVHDRAVFARGALAAVRFLHGKEPGTYTVHDALLRG